MKKIIRVVIVAAILLIVAAVVVFIYVDSIAKRTVEERGTYLLGVPTTLDAAHVGVFRGRLTVTGINIANPEGFEADHFMLVDDGALVVSLGTLLKQTIHAPSLNLDGLDIHLQKREGRSNYDLILANLRRFQESPDKSPGDDAKAKRYIIDEVVLTNIIVHVDLLPIAGDLTRLELPIERIVLRNVGSDSQGGVLLTELGKILVQSLAAAIVEKGHGIIPDDMLGDLRGHLARLTDLSALGIDLNAHLPANIDDILREQGLDEIGERLDETLRDAGEGLRDILRGRERRNDDG